MNFITDRLAKEYGRRESSNVSVSDVFEPTLNSNAKQRAALVEWLNNILPNLNLQKNASEEELRAHLIDGTVLCQILNLLRPGSVTEYVGSDHSLELGSENVKRFLAAMDKMKLPRFQVSDLEKGSMKIVIECLLTLRAQFMPNIGRHNIANSSSADQSRSDASRRWKYLGEHFGSEVSSRVYPSVLSGEERKKGVTDSKFQRALRSPFMAEPSAALIHDVGHKFQEVFQMKQGRYQDLSAAKISEMMKSNSLDNAPTQSLLSVVNGILDESIERKNGEIPHRVACLLRKVVQEIERRISTQAEHLRTQNSLFKAREEKYQSRIRVLEALAAGTSDETEIVVNQLQKIKVEKNKVEEKKKLEEQVVVRVMKDNDQSTQEISVLKQEVEITKKTCEQRCLQVEKESEGARKELEERLKEVEITKKTCEQRCLQLEKEAEGARKELEERLKEVEITKKTFEQRCLQVEKEAEGARKELEERLKEVEITKQTCEQRGLRVEKEAEGARQELEERLKEAVCLLTESKNRVKELEAYSESKSMGWNKKESIYQIFTEFQLGALRELRFSSQSIKQEILKTQKSYSEDFHRIGLKIKALTEASENYNAVLAENRKMYNELQDLKGNIRVYCRVRPFLPGQTGKQSTIEYIGEGGELVVANPSKQGKDGRRSFKFNKVYDQAATQVEVFSDIKPLIRSVLDGYNVCIFAYGQTGSGKTYTMTGPDRASEEEWGVNYRALNDLFHICETRKNVFMYEIGVQMVEIYNEQVRDLLSSDGSVKKLGILSTSQPSGLAVPDASMHPVKSTLNVLELMETGLKNRAKGATAMNERSSRSHSIVTIHVRGTELKTDASLRGSLHLVDLAGSERVDRSEVTGDRLKEAQHINKSLSALGDVIFALAQKSSHVPYRNSKLTQVLQSSLGGQAKTIMFVQLNPDVNSCSETLSTLKFAERVSGIELGAAKSSKEGRDVKELMEQVASLKDTIGKKDEEIERLQVKR